MSAELSESTVVTNGVRLHVVQAGPDDGPRVILLHGFPEAALCWRHQIRPLAEAGYHVLAPDQRGYSTSDKPGPVSAYGLDVLAADIVGLLDHERAPRAVLVGHDWGGIVAWWVALCYPERVQRIAVVNAPHPVAFRRYLVSHPRQLLKSWYVFFFQIPGWPESHLRRKDWRALVTTMRSSSRPGTFSDGDFELYRQAWSQPGAMRAMIHWYRAALRHPPRPPADRLVHMPALIIWGEQDRFLDPGLGPASLAFCENGRLVAVPQATHWIQHEEPGRVNRLLLEFLSG